MKFTTLLRAAILCVTVCVFATAQVKPEETGRGAEWFSWTPIQRNAYVYGLVDGYSMGFARACFLADELYETDKPHRLGENHHPSDFPSARCMVQRGEFSKKTFDEKGHPDVSAYTHVITTFYKRYPKCRDFPFSFLLESLSSNYAAADQLYEMAVKGKLEHYPRSGQWCNSNDAQEKKP